jgi:hypothetical protein
MTPEQKSRERRHLIEANNHLAAACVRIAILEQHVHASDAADDKAREASRLLSATRKSFETMSRHRAVIEHNMKRA